MRLAIQYARSFVFIVQMYIAMAAVALAFAPFAAFRREMALKACHTYCRYVRWTAEWMVGLHVDIRGEIPDYAALIAAKHQSFFDIILIFGALPNPRFVMKKQLMRTPFLGWYAKWLGCIPVWRGSNRAARLRVRSLSTPKARASHPASANPTKSALPCSTANLGNPACPWPPMSGYSGPNAACCANRGQPW